MSAGLLREAASLMRERAEFVAEKGIWDWREKDTGRGWWQGTSNGDFIQSMSPAVALAVADWLEADATPPFGPTKYALAVARAYLGRDA